MENGLHMMINIGLSRVIKGLLGLSRVIKGYHGVIRVIRVVREWL